VPAATNASAAAANPGNAGNNDGANGAAGGGGGAGAGGGAMASGTPLGTNINGQTGIGNYNPFPGLMPFFSGGQTLGGGPNGGGGGGPAVHDPPFNGNTGTYGTGGGGGAAAPPKRQYRGGPMEGSTAFAPDGSQIRLDPFLPPTMSFPAIMPRCMACHGTGFATGQVPFSDLPPAYQGVIIAALSTDPTDEVLMRAGGALQAVGGGALALAAGGVAVVDPEPATKVGAGVLAGIGADNYLSGMNLALFGKYRQTAFASALSAGAQGLGASKEFGDHFGNSANDATMIVGPGYTSRLFQRAAAVGAEAEILAPSNAPARISHSNLYPEDAYNPVQRFELRQVDGMWKTFDGRGNAFTARGNYNYVVSGDKIYAVKVPSQPAMGQSIPGHIDIARGGNVDYAGEIRFGSGLGNRGQLQWWDNSSGHYQPKATDAGSMSDLLPINLFKGRYP
jgi:hypothetical protein